MVKHLLILTALFALLASYAYGQDYTWYRGNTHTHSNNSDGDSPPDTVAKWYKDHTYNFLVLTDHNKLTSLKELQDFNDKNFLLIPGEEVTEYLGKKAIHLNGININKLVEPRHGATVEEILKNDLEAIKEAGGLAQINHPNWRWSFTDKEIISLNDGKSRSYLLEVYNICKDCNNYGGGGHISTEEIWDRLLSRGMVVYGIASDDTHCYTGERMDDKPIPGRGWIMVKARALTAVNIVKSLESGAFYATNGVTIDDIKVNDKEYVVTMKPHRELRYTTLFIGQNGRILKKDTHNTAVYTFTGKEHYVRAKVICSSGDFAITQPVFLKKQ
jgi:hypothetical protein